MMIDRMSRTTNNTGLAVLIPVVPSKQCVIVTHTIEDRWDEKDGWFQVVINKIKGVEWNVGKDYDHDGYVERLNNDILDGKFS